jgi:tungstate transport system substrate-binding protein
MRIFVRVGMILFALFLSSAQAGAQDKTVAVGTPTGVLAALVGDLALAFRAQTGIAVRVVAGEGKSLSEADALLLPARLTPAGVDRRTILFGEGILVGSRSDRARVRGQRDMKTAFRWIASARALYVSSSPAMGLRDLELRLWEEIGVNVRTRSTWYIDVVGDEAAVFSKAAQLGAYTLIQRATWAAQENRRGLEIIAEGDPLLRTDYTTALLRPGSREATAWHEWLSSDEGQAAIAAWTLNGAQVFSAASQQGGAGAVPPRT